jgi:hypothetical protein
MSNLKSLQSQVDRMQKRLLPSPKLIHCGQAKDELLAMVEQQMHTRGEVPTPVVWTEEQLAFADDFDALLDAMNKRTEETCNVKFV